MGKKMILYLLNALISTIVSVVVAFSSIGVAAETPGTKVYNYPLFNSKLESALRVRTFGLHPNGHLTVTYDDIMAEAFRDLENASGGFSFEKIANQLPDIYHYLRWMYSLSPATFNNWRDDLLAKADQLEKEDKDAEMVITRLLGLSVALPKEIHIFARPTRQANVYEMMLGTRYADGSEASIYSGIQYHTDTGLMEQGAAGLGSTGMEMNLKQALANSTQIPALQRKLGYAKLYDDVFLQTSDMLNVTTVRFKFKYLSKEWLLQLWKGRYFATTGAEVGLYNRSKDKNPLLNGTALEWYDCVSDNERIGMSLKLTANDGALLMDRPQENHWWMTGFAAREYLYTPDRLTLETLITPTDDEMKAGLIQALDEQIKNGEKIVYEVLSEAVVTETEAGPQTTTQTKIKIVW
jgi:hypothetical protein